MSAPTATPTPAPASVAAGGGREASGAATLWAATARYRPVLALVVVLFVVFSLTQPFFLTGANLRNMLTSVSALWVVAMGMTFILISGAIDLSVGATAALCGVVFASLLTYGGMPGPLALVVTVAVGALIGGVVNGLLIGPVGLSFFVVTLGSMTAMTGVVRIWTDTDSVPVRSATTTFLAAGTVAGLALPVVIMIVSFALAWYVQRHTYLGRDFFAIGGNATAAQLAGIRTARTTVWVFTGVGACAGLAGVMAVARIGAATPQVDNNLPLQAIAAVLLGGTSILGGAGGVGGTAIGVLFVGVLQNGLSIAGVASDWQLVVTGVILVAAVAGDRVRRRNRVRTQAQQADATKASAPGSPPTAAVAAPAGPDAEDAPAGPGGATALGEGPAARRDGRTPPP